MSTANDAMDGNAMDGGAEQAADEDAGAPVAIEDFREAVLHAQCAKLVGCHQVESVEACERVFEHTGFEYRLLAVAAGRSVYHPERAARCIEHAGDDRCTAEVPVDDPCEGVFTGTLALNSACRSDDECIDGLSCPPNYWDCPNACCQSTCQPPPPVIPVGDGCTHEGEFTCERGSVCWPRYDSGAPGQPHCVENRGLLAKAGEPCDPEHSLCAERDTYCDAVTSTCVRRKTVGEGCSGQQGECNAFTTCAAGTCQRLPLPGEPCTELGCYSDWAACEHGECVGPPSLECPLAE